MKEEGRSLPKVDSSQGGNAVDLNHDIQQLRPDCRSYRIILGEEFAVDLVEGGEVPQVAQEYLNLNHILHPQINSMQNRADVFKGLTGLVSKRPWYFTRLWIRRSLSGYEDESVRDHGMGIWANRINGTWDGSCFSHGCSLSEES